jgi:hypothetical protein
MYTNAEWILFENGHISTTLFMFHITAIYSKTSPNITSPQLFRRPRQLHSHKLCVKISDPSKMESSPLDELLQSPNVEI